MNSKNSSSFWYLIEFGILWNLKNPWVFGFSLSSFGFDLGWVQISKMPGFQVFGYPTTSLFSVIFHRVKTKNLLCKSGEKLFCNIYVCCGWAILVIEASFRREIAWCYNFISNLSLLYAFSMFSLLIFQGFWKRRISRIFVVRWQPILVLNGTCLEMVN